MAHHKSTIKRIRTNETSRQYNKRYKTELKSALKDAFAAETKDDGSQKISKAFKLLDKLVQKNILHKNNASNQKSRLSKFVNGLA
ncbi:MAG: 30S ribosomal protein S20 [Calditrichaeota bacterium]|nr:MAG: 30S ribosomal protein S20 [Calditrichota bacterium]MBL1205040.1 30S ribosomal protein S20 [Calditrichota bacterium]NOG44870.1 30S ribosomal protein S20 [Calditrichota bacterium]